MGSDAELVLRRSPVPVLLVRDVGAEQAERERRRHTRQPDQREDARGARLIVDRILQRNAGTVGAVPVRESHISERGSRYIRFCYAGTTADMAKAVRRLQEWQRLRRAK